MPTLDATPVPGASLRRRDELSFPALCAAQGTVGELLARKVTQARSNWYGRSAVLDARIDSENIADFSAPYLRLSVTKTVQSTFRYIGRIQPLPVPDLDDSPT